MSDAAAQIVVALTEFVRHDRRPLALLEKSGRAFRLNPTGVRPDRETLPALAQGATGIVAGPEPYDAAMLDRLPSLRCISRCGVGVDNIDLEAARARGIAVLSTPAATTEAVAELALTFILALHRNLVRQAASMRRREWVRPESHLLAGRRVALVGLGRIGRRLVELLTPFRVHLTGVDPLPDLAWCAAAGVAPLPLADALSGANVVSIQAAVDPAHPLRLGAAELALLPRGAMLVNVARGSLVDEGALHAALSSGHLAGAALDVYSEEPYRGPLCDLESVILTPHSATDAVESRVAMETKAVENLLRFLAGEVGAGDFVVPPGPHRSAAPSA